MFILIALVSRCIFSSVEEESEAEFLTTKQLKQLARDGIPMFSLMASLSVENQAVIDKLQVVCEFPEVFPDEIPDVPPEREVEFSIDLVLGTKPVSMAPYRMSASELAELKKQLEDLLDKKFVRPSVHLGERQCCWLRRKMVAWGCVLIIDSWIKWR